MRILLRTLPWSTFVFPLIVPLLLTSSAAGSKQQAAMQFQHYRHLLRHHRREKRASLRRHGNAQLRLHRRLTRDRSHLSQPWHPVLGPRFMTDPAGNKLFFNLYTDEARITVWGSWYSGTKAPTIDVPLGRSQKTTGSAVIYARVDPNQQSIPNGVYNSAIKATTLHSRTTTPAPETASHPSRAQAPGQRSCLDHHARRRRRPILYGNCGA